MHTPYPLSFPSECLADLISIGRGGLDEIANRRSEVGLHLWNVQGFAQAMLLGNPDQVGSHYHGIAETDDPALAEQLSEFTAVYAAAAGLSYLSAPTQPAAMSGRVNWRALIAFLKEIMPIILPLILDEVV